MTSPAFPGPSEPQSTALPGRYEFIWGPEEIVLRLFRIHERADSITAQVEIQDTSSGEARHLYGADRLSLSSGESRAKLAKALTARRNGLPWAYMLEQAVNSALQHRTAGEPLIEVGGLPLSKAPLWRLEPIMPEGVTTVLTGDGGTGKSTLAVLFGLCISQGYGQPLGLKAQKGPVLYIDYETDWQRINDLCLELEAAMELPERPHLYYLRLDRPILDEDEHIRQLIAAHKIEAIIVDSAAPAFGGERELKENATPSLRCMAAWHIAVLLISHIPKDELHPSRKPYGSVFIHNLGRHHWFLKAAQEPGEEAWDVALHNTKSNVSRLLPARGFHIDRSLDCKITATSVSAHAELRKGLSAISQIKAVLLRGSLSVATIAEQTEIPEPTVRTRLTDGKKRGIFTNPAPGLWGLPEVTAS